MELTQCIRNLNELVFIGTYQGQKVIVKILTPAYYDSEKNVLIPNNTYPQEAEIMQYIQKTDSNLKIPTLLNVITLSKQEFKQIYKEHPLVRENFCLEEKDFDVIKTVYALVIEYIEGQIPSSEEILLYQMNIAIYIENLHKIGIVHADIKKDNLILSIGGIYLIDFGSSFGIQLENTIQWKSKHILKDCPLSEKSLVDWSDFVHLLIQCHLKTFIDFECSEWINQSLIQYDENHGINRENYQNFVNTLLKKLVGLSVG